MTILDEVFMNKCKVEGCEKLSSTKRKRGLCFMHKSRWQLFKSYDRPQKKSLPPGIVFRCKVHGELTNKQARTHKFKHIDKLYYSCKLCRNIYKNKKYKENPEIVKHTNNKYYMENREKCKKRMIQYNYANSRKGKNTKLRKVYGITIDQFEKMLIEQNNSCKICKTKCDGTNKSKKIYVDHCHATKKVRALLCSNCNLGLGHFKDSIELLESAIDYIKIFK